MVSNSQIVIIAGIGFFGFGTLAYYTWKKTIRNFIKFKKYKERVGLVEAKDALVSPDGIDAEFRGMTDEQRKAGKELLVMGYALSYKSWMMIDQKLLQITPELTNYMMGLPKEIMVINKFYPQSIFGILSEDEYYRDTYGYKFAIQHKGNRSIFIEPYMRTELLGFPEFYHKKRTKWYQRFWDMINSWSSTDPFENYSYSSGILWEGDYITAFGLVSYQASNDTFTMTKPIAIVKGGIDELKRYFAKRAAEKGAKSYIYLISAVFLTTATIACYYVGKHYYKRLEERAAERADKITELDNMTCSHCNQNKKEVIFEPCLHLLYCNNCCTDPATTLNKDYLKKCQKCNESIVSWKKIFIP